MADWEWIDTHIHISNFDSEGRERDFAVDDLLIVLDREPGDLRFVLSPDVGEVARVKADPDWLLRANRFIHDVCMEAPDRLFGSCLVNPNYLEPSLACMDKCFTDWGFVQLGEMLQYILDFDMAGPEAAAVTRRAAEFGVPVQCHVSTMTELCVEHFAGVRDLARQVPEAHIILAHALGGANTRYYIEESERAGMDPDRTWFEFRDFHDVAATRLALERLRPDRMVPGTDWVTRIGPPYLPYGMVFNHTLDTNPYPPSAEALRGFLSEAGATAEQVNQIGSANPRELLGWRLARHVTA